MRENLLQILTLEPVAILYAYAAVSYLFYKIFLRKVSASRHEIFSGVFRALFFRAGSFLPLWLLANFLGSLNAIHPAVFPFVATLAVLAGAMLFVQASKAYVFEYFFLTSMRAGVPVLLVNLVTLGISIFLGIWILNGIYKVNLAPLLATSALLSVVLGLALQDTLGNLFAGISIQFDKPYEIGDWIEVHTAKTSFQGKVQEITWRSTLLIGFNEEHIVLPNRLIANSEIANYSSRGVPPFRGVDVYLKDGQPEAQIRPIFENALKTARGVRQDFPHYVMLRGMDHRGEWWRLFFPIETWAESNLVVDWVLTLVKADFEKAGIRLAEFRISQKV